MKHVIETESAKIEVKHLDDENLSKQEREIHFVITNLSELFSDGYNLCKNLAPAEKLEPAPAPEAQDSPFSKDSEDRLLNDAMLFMTILMNFYIKILHDAFGADPNKLDVFLSFHKDFSKEIEHILLAMKLEDMDFESKSPN